MMSRITSKLNNILFVALAFTYVACSQQEAPISEQASQSVGNKQNSADANSSSALSTGTSTNAATNPVVSPNGVATNSRTAAPGCALPAPAAKLMLKGGSSGAAALTTWTCHGTVPPLKNLNLTDCDWYNTAKRTNSNSYMVVYEKDQQSYAQLYPGDGSLLTYTACITSAMSTQVSLGGEVTCAVLP